MAVPIYTALGQPRRKAGLTADDIVTNQFIDPSIGLSAAAASTARTQRAQAPARRRARGPSHRGPMPVGTEHGTAPVDSATASS